MKWAQFQGRAPRYGGRIPLSQRIITHISHFPVMSGSRRIRQARRHCSKYLQTASNRLTCSRRVYRAPRDGVAVRQKRRAQERARSRHNPLLMGHRGVTGTSKVSANAGARLARPAQRATHLRAISYDDAASHLFNSAGVQVISTLVPRCSRLTASRVMAAGPNENEDGGIGRQVAGRSARVRWR